jgi:hypothetical protein
MTVCTLCVMATPEARLCEYAHGTRFVEVNTSWQAHTYHSVDGPRRLRGWEAVVSPVVREQTSQIGVARDPPQHVGHRLVTDDHVCTTHD